MFLNHVYRDVSMIRLLSLFALVGLPSAAVLAQDSADRWGRWRGPNNDGSSATADPPVEWNAQQNMKWKVAVPGEGSATPIVWDDRIFVVSAIETERKGDAESASGDPQESEQPAADGRGRRGFGRPRPPAPTNIFQWVVMCYDRETGERLWQQVAAEEVPHEPGHETNTFASSSPVTDGRHVYVSFGSRGIFCFDMDGNKKWERSLGRMQTRMGFGEGGSPALHENTLVVPWDHEGDSSVVALDAATGEIRWQTERDERTTWATPLITEYNGRTQVITNATRVRSYDLDTGELIWECGGQVDNPIPSPIRFEDSVICMTGYRGNSIVSVSLDAQGDVTDTAKVLWSRDDAAPYVPSATLYKGQLYLTKSNQALITSIDARTGEVIIPQQRLPGASAFYASPVAAQDRIYFVDRGGTTVVIEHGTELEVIATNPLDDEIDASPVIVGNDLILRGKQFMYCISER